LIKVALFEFVADTKVKL